MGTLRKLGQMLGLIKKDKSLKPSSQHQMTKKTILQKLKEEIKEAIADNEPKKAKRWYSPYEVPGAFGKRPTISNCRKMWKIAGRYS